MPSSRSELFAAPTISRTNVLAGARWRGLLQAGQQVLSLLATVVLARLLTPAEIGVTAAALFVLGLFGVAGAGATGLYAAVVKRKTIDDAYLGGALTANLVLGVTLTCLGMLLTPMLAELAGIGDHSSAVVVLMPLLTLGTLQSVSMSLLDRRMASGRVALAGLASAVLYVIVEITLAIAGLGYWAVIIGYAAGQVLYFLLVVTFARWRPILRWPIAVWREDGAFSMKVSLNVGLEYAGKNIDYWVVGGLLGASALGSYYIAFALPTMLRVRMHAVMGQLLFPMFAHLKSDPARTRRAYASTFCLSAALAVPMMLGIAVVTPALVSVLFGDQWRGSVAPMRWVAVAAIFEFLSAGLGAAAISYGLMRRLVLVNASKMAVLALAILVFFQFSQSITAVSVAVVVSAVYGAAANQLLLARLIGLPLSLVARPLTLICVAGGVMSPCAWVAQEWIDRAGGAPFLQLLVAVPVGVVLYVMVGLAIARDDFQTYAKDLKRILGARS